MDNRGNITLEIAVALIVLVLIFGVVISLNEIGTQKVINNQKTEHVETLIETSVDNLINNPGNPKNWEEYGKGTPGLAIVNEEGQIIPNSVSYSKYMALAKNYKKLVTKQLFDSKIKTSMELIPRESSISSVKIGVSPSGNNIYSVNRFVKCDFYKRYVIKDFQSDGKCNHDHDQNDYSCNYFKLFKGNFRNSDYYLLISDGEKDNLKYMVDTTRVVKGKPWHTTSSKKVYLNDEIDFYDDTSAIVFIHFDKPKAKALLVCVPKNFDENKLTYDYFRTNECKLIITAGY